MGNFQAGIISYSENFYLSSYSRKSRFPLAHPICANGLLTGGWIFAKSGFANTQLLRAQTGKHQEPLDLGGGGACAPRWAGASHELRLPLAKGRPPGLGGGRP